MADQPRPNPRPVLVGETGVLTEVTGELIVVPGLEPDAVLRGIADATAGRYRPLSEIMTERR